MISEHAPDMVCMPVGNAGNITSYWLGFREYAEIGRANSRPRMMGFQAAGAAPIVLGERVETSRNRRYGDTHWESGELGTGRTGAGRVRRPH